MRYPSELLCLALAARALHAGSGALAYATYLGGDGADIIHAMATDASNNIYLTGETFPRPRQIAPLHAAIASARARPMGHYQAKLDLLTTSPLFNSRI